MLHLIRCRSSYLILPSDQPTCILIIEHFAHRVVICDRWQTTSQSLHHHSIPLLIACITATHSTNIKGIVGITNSDPTHDGILGILCKDVHWISAIITLKLLTRSTWEVLIFSSLPTVVRLKGIFNHWSSSLFLTFCGWENLSLVELMGKQILRGEDRRLLRVECVVILLIIHVV
jgi:hypothetical protein